MEDRNQIRVLNAVRRATVEAPELGTRELHERVAERYPWIVGMDLRAFYSRFVRRAQKEAGLKPGRKNRAGARSPSTQRKKPDRSTTADRKVDRRKTQPQQKVDRQKPQRQRKVDRRKTRHHQNGRSAEERRARIRQSFVEFAQEVVTARTDAEIIEVIRRLDPYLDRVLSA